MSKRLDELTALVDAIDNSGQSLPHGAYSDGQHGAYAARRRCDSYRDNRTTTMLLGRSVMLLRAFWDNAGNKKCPVGVALPRDEGTVIRLSED